MIIQLDNNTEQKQILWQQSANCKQHRSEYHQSIQGHKLEFSYRVNNTIQQ
jgi:hypothetical protein